MPRNTRTVQSSAPYRGCVTSGDVDARAEPLARVVRGGVVEAVHHGHLVGLTAAGATAVVVGNPDATFLPRSSLKPVQAVGMLRAGLDLSGELLGLAAASHSGEPAHLQGVGRILAGAGLTPGDLQNTPGLPLDPDAAAAWRRVGLSPAPIAQNCSGKHAAMLATCRAAGWDTVGYLDPAHPLQRALRATVAELTGVPAAHTTVDGCGAPLFSTTPAGLARAFARIATAPPDTPEGTVGVALREHPWWVAGTGRDVARLAAAVPGLIAKDGAEGVFAAALPDGRAVVVKVLDGSPRPVATVVAAALRALGADAPDLDVAARTSVLGHGVPVGRVEPLVGVAAAMSPR
jgi:L-asparaginase II